MLFFIFALVATFFTSTVSAHMTLANPVPFGSPSTSPLNSDGSNFPCQVTGDATTFYTSTAASTNNTLAIGETHSVSFSGSAVHGGGSCQLALTSDLVPTTSSVWQVILSIEGGCPTTDGNGPSTYDYTIPSSIASGKYVFAWTWVSKLSGAPEYYMNCAPVTVTGSSSKREAEPAVAVSGVEERASSALPNLFVANLASINSCKTSVGTDVVFPDPGSAVSKPSTMSTNFQSPTGDNCFPVGGTGTDGSSSGSGSSSSVAAVASASTSAAAGTTAPASSATAITSAASSSAAVATIAKSSGGIFVTASVIASSAAAVISTPVAAATTGAATTGAAPATTAAATTGAATTGAATTAAATTGGAPATTAAAAATTAATTTAAAAATTAATTTAGSGTTSGSGLSGSCTSEGMFNCVDGTEYQQCASGSWTALRPMADGTTCQPGQSNTLWARGRNARFRRAHVGM